MNWHPETAYNIRSDCGQYSVSKYRINGQMYYEAWHKDTRGHLAAGLTNADEAKRVCEAHADRQRRAA